jgi:quercetin dioxygenase-like cupin family protein
MGSFRRSNGDEAAMIDAEVNEGGPPSPIPCDTPVDGPASQEMGHSMSEISPIVTTCPAPDRILRLPVGETVAVSKSTTLLKSAGLDLIRLVIPAGKEVPPHKAPGEITVQCIEGRVLFEHDGGAVEMQPGDLLYLCPQEIHSLKGIVDSAVLVTRLRPRADELPEKFPES